jgi:hypothetical protein
MKYIGNIDIKAAKVYKPAYRSRSFVASGGVDDNMTLAPTTSKRILKLALALVNPSFGYEQGTVLTFASVGKHTDHPQYDDHGKHYKHCWHVVVKGSFTFTESGKSKLMRVGDIFRLGSTELHSVSTTDKLCATVVLGYDP